MLHNVHSKYLGFVLLFSLIMEVNSPADSATEPNANAPSTKYEPPDFLQTLKPRYFNPRQRGRLPGATKHERMAHGYVHLQEYYLFDKKTQTATTSIIGRDGKLEKTYLVAYDSMGHCTGVGYPPLYDNGIVPILGFFYKKTKGKYTWIPKKQWPKGLSIHPNSVTFPLRFRQRGGGDIPHHTLRYVPEEGDCTVIRLLSIQINPKKQLTARITLIPQKSGKKAEYKNAKIITVREGEILLMGKERWQVEAIVPHDKRKRIIGWIQFRPVRRQQFPAVVVESADKKTLTLRRAKKGETIDKPTAWISTTFKDKKKSQWNAGLWLRETKIPVPKIFFTTKTFHPLKLSYPPLSTGDLLPLFGNYYRVKSVSDTAITFQKLSVQEIQKTLQPQYPNTVFIPLRVARGGHPALSTRGICGDDSFSHIYVKQLVPRNEPTTLDPVMSSVVIERRALNAKVKFLLRERKCSEFLPERLYKLRRVIQPDAKLKTIGWIEMTPFSFPKNQAEKSKKK